MLTPLLALALTAAPQGTPAPPRLVVMIAVDQLIPEQLQRLDARFTGGFRRFLDQGAVFWRATVDYAATETGPGHATFATGRWPRQHGIVGNAYYERASGKPVYCINDPAAHPLSETGVDESRASVSAATLLGDAFGDFLERSFPGSKTLTFAGKDRAAVLMGGRGPDAALWWSGSEGGFTSSSAYGTKLPEFVTVWNSAWRERARGWEWRVEAGNFAALGTGSDDREGEVKRNGRTLPRSLPAEDGPLAGAVLFSPLLDFFTLELATLALDSQGLGRDDAVDFLGLSLSACDVLGHSFGPDSVEVTDLLLRDDRDLGRFFQQLDERVGAGRWLACLSSDHGVLDLPEQLQSELVGARRVKGEEVAALRRAMQEGLVEVHPEASALELRYFELGFGFDEAAARAAGLEPAELRRTLAEIAEATPWVADAYTLEELLGDGPADPWLTLYRRSSHAERTADVVLRPDPWLLFDFPEGTSHGSPYPYDRRVPLLFLGGKVKAQHRFDRASPTDAAPTLLGLLGVKAPPGLDGRVLKVD
jgi:predicted AlkP superfamily pyrophosphatase or phosphodiesterase